MVRGGRRATLTHARAPNCPREVTAPLKGGARAVTITRSGTYNQSPRWRETMAKSNVTRKKRKTSKPAMTVATGIRAGGMSTNHNRVPPR